MNTEARPCDISLNLESNVRNISSTYHPDDHFYIFSIDQATKRNVKRFLKACDANMTIQDMQMIYIIFRLQIEVVQKFALPIIEQKRAKEYESINVNKEQHIKIAELLCYNHNKMKRYKDIASHHIHHTIHLYTGNPKSVTKYNIKGLFYDFNGDINCFLQRFTNLSKTRKQRIEIMFKLEYENLMNNILNSFDYINILLIQYKYRQNTI